MVAGIPERETILVVDDTPANLSLLNHILRDQYRVKLANSGAKALELAAASVPDLVLLDILMPSMDGFEVCRRLKADPLTAKVPVLFLTAKAEIEDEELGFLLGAVDFIHKPITPPIVLARVRTHLHIKNMQDFLEDKSAWLENEVDRRISQVLRMQEATIHVMVSLAEFRDQCTGNHIRRTQQFVRLLAEWLARHSRSKYNLSRQNIDDIAKAAPLHDIGKIAIPDHILLKPGKLTFEEFEIMKTHSVRGWQLLTQAQQEIGGDDSMLRYACEISRHHHEKWNGTGYPDGLSGEAIPLSARIMAVADVYDAVRSVRPYKGAYTHAQATELIAEGRESHFDPDLVDAFLALHAEFENIAALLADEQNAPGNPLLMTASQ